MALRAALVPLLMVMMANLAGKWCEGGQSRTFGFNSAQVASVTDERYLSVTLDWSKVKSNLAGMNFTNPVRLGGYIVY